jgi:hypothetical protein
MRRIRRELRKRFKKHALFIAALLILIVVVVIAEAVMPKRDGGDDGSRHIPQGQSD